MLATYMGEQGMKKTMSTPLQERDMYQVIKHKCTEREFKMMTELGSYEMDGFMLDLGSYMNILPNKSWELMGKPSLVWSPIQLWLENQYMIYPIGRLDKVEVNIKGVEMKVDFEVVDIMDNFDPYT
jgi:hypothetical protein